MSTFKYEEKKRTTTYDFKIIKWLFGFIKGYKLFFILSLFFMILTAVLEVSVPYLTKEAVDNYIFPNWREFNLPEQSDEFKRIAEIKEKFEADIIETDKGKYVIDFSELGRADKTDLESQGFISDKRYLVIDTENFPEESKKDLIRIVNSYESKFIISGRYYITKYENLKNFRKTEIKILRLPDKEKIIILVFYIFLCILGIFISATTFTYLLYYSGHNIMHKIRKTTFEHILKLPQKYFDQNPVGRITTRVTNDVNAINDMYTSVMVQFIKDIIVVFTVLIILFHLNKKLTLIIIALTVFLGIVAALFRMRLKSVFRQIRMTIGKLNAFVQESIQGIVILKLYGKEKNNFERFININRENYKANMDQLWTYVMFRPFIEYISILGTGLIIWYGGFSVINQNLTLGSLIAYLYYVRMIFKPIQELSEKYNIFQSAAAASENLYDILQENTELSGNKTPNEQNNVIEFENVWFSYNNKEWVLKDVSFKIEPGKTVALVGLTGSGKTTIVNLLLKFYKIQRGKILFRGVDINQIDTHYLRENITAIFQDLFLFGKEISDEEINFSTVRQQYGINYTMETKNNLSSGENQIISIAKAFDKESSLLVMDEATSNIDAGIEKNIQKLINEKIKTQTKLIIAHRLSNVRNADRIIVIHKGKIVEQGNHIELIKNKNIYFTLHNFQKEVGRISPEST